MSKAQAPMHSVNTLYSELSRSLIDINKQVDVIMDEHNVTNPMDAYALRATDGTYLLAGLLQVRVECLAAMAKLRCMR